MPREVREAQRILSAFEAVLTRRLDDPNCDEAGCRVPTEDR